MPYYSDLQHPAFHKRCKSLIPYIVTLCILLTLWHISSLYLNTPLLPTPYNVGIQVLQLWSSPLLQPHIFASMYRLLLGIAIAFIFSIPLGMWSGFSHRGNQLLSPFLYLFYSIPKVIFLPLIMLALGIGNATKIFLISFTLFFHLTVIIRDAVRSIDPFQIDILRSFGATPLQLIRHLLWPASLSPILTSLRTGLGIALALLFITETFASDKGLGYFIMNAMEIHNYEEMYAAIITLGLIGLSLYITLDQLEIYLCPWKHKQKNNP